MEDPYFGREQTKAKHFILKSYLQALAFKVLTFTDITYVDGFSGPWKSNETDFKDSSFMIAISVLLDAQEQLFKRSGKRRQIKCFFSENDPIAYDQLKKAVAPFDKPEIKFKIVTYFGNFEDAVPEIEHFIGNSFPLIFIDPTGWTGYPLSKIKSLFDRQKCEVVINFMYDFIQRFVNSDDLEIIASFDPILGGSGWRERLDPNLGRGLAVEKLFRDTLRSEGKFKFVVSTKIDKSTAERPHFFIVYGTKSADGLKAFRETEYKALRKHEKSRSLAKSQKRTKNTGMEDMFSDHQAGIQEATIDELVKEQSRLARDDLLVTLEGVPNVKFKIVVAAVLQAYMLRETNVKDICIDLANAGKLENTWGTKPRKPGDDDDIILLKTIAK